MPQSVVLMHSSGQFGKNSVISKCQFQISSMEREWFQWDLLAVDLGFVYYSNETADIFQNKTHNW